MKRDETAPYDPRLKILHADMDAFYAAVEVLDDPSLRGKPLIIGHPGRRGVVSTASYEARRFGVHSAMPSVEALRRCPQGVWRAPRMKRYAELSRRIRDVFRSYTPLVEPLSLDEAFLDCEGSLRLFGGAIQLAEQLREQVRSETGGLTVSVGVAPNKFLAKLGSDLDKPDGLTVIHPDRIEEQLAPLPIRRIWGVGKKTAAALAQRAIHTIGDVLRWDREALIRELGPASGAHIYNLARGRDSRSVETSHEAKSISNESTFSRDLTREEDVHGFLFRAAENVATTLRDSGLLARTVQLKVRTGSFRTMTRSRTLAAPTHLAQVLAETGIELMREKVDLGGEGIRLLGLGAKGLVDADALVQGDLFSESGQDCSERAAAVSDRVRKALGRSAITRGRLLGGPEGPPPDERDPDDPARIRPGDLWDA